MEREKNPAQSLEKAVRRILPTPPRTCKACGRRFSEEQWRENARVCPACGRYYPLPAGERLSLILDPGSERIFGEEVAACDPLSFPGYKEKLAATKEDTSLAESVVTAEGTIGGIACIAAVMDTRFFMGSMSSAVGERITRAFERADEKSLPIILFAASGGARMQEGIYSLVQMAKTAAAVELFSEHGGLFISVFTHPTTGGVTASFASLGDITLAEPGALIGFAGPRVIEQTIGQKLPKGFQRAEYLCRHGFVDKIVARRDQRAVLLDLLRLHAREEELAQ
jgi:acetyl-CoA carboxylase carboxyl transferase subunit beta